MRGATPYDGRGSTLALPKGSAANPALRLGGERSGLFLVAPGRLGLAIGTLPVLEADDRGLLFRSHAPGGDTVTPLALQRVNPTTADGQETTLDLFEGPSPSGRLASYRAAPGRFGWKLYGAVAGVPTAALLTASPDGDLALIRDLDAGRHARVGGDLTVLGGLTTSGAARALSLTLTAAAGATALSIPNGNASIGGGLGVGGTAAINGALTLGGALTMTAPSGDLTVAAAAKVSGAVYFGATATVGALGGTGSAQLNVYPSGPYALYAAAGANLAFALGDHGVLASAGRRLVMGLNVNAAGVLGGTGGAGEIYTSGPAAGPLHLGTAGVGRVVVGSPSAALQVIPAVAADGIYIGSSAFTPSLHLGNNATASSATSHAYLGQAIAGGNYVSVSQPGDLVLTTAGPSPARLLLGTANAARLLIDANGIAGFDGQLAVGSLSGLGSAQLNLYPSGPTAIHAASGTNQSIALSDNGVLANAGRRLVMGLNVNAGGALGGGLGAGEIYTSGAGAGPLILGTAGLPRAVLDASGAGFVGPLAVGSLSGAGSGLLNLYPTGPYALHAASGANQSIALSNDGVAANASRRLVMGLTNNAVGVLGGPAGSAEIFTSGAAAGPLILGTAGASRLYIAATGEITTSGPLSVGGPVYPGGQAVAALRCPRPVYSLGVNEDISLGAPQGLVLVMDLSGGSCRLVASQAGLGVVDIGGTAGFVVGTDTGSGVAIYCAASLLRLHNRTGFVQVVLVLALGA